MRAIMLVILTVSVIITSACTTDRDLKKLLSGAWHCLSEPGVVRIFYVNNSYLEFGRKEPYARKNRWRRDYISIGKFRLQKSVISIDSATGFFESSDPSENSSGQKTTIHFKIQDLGPRLLFLKRHNSGTPEINSTENRSLLCRKTSRMEFREFTTYLRNKHKKDKQRVQYLSDQKRLLHEVIRNKKSLTRRLNSILCNQLKVNMLWLLNKLEEASKTMQGQFTVQMTRRNGGFFQVKIISDSRSVQRNIMKILRYSDQLTFKYTRIYKINKKQHLNIFFERNHKSETCLSLVSLPVSADWLSEHKLQLIQLQRLANFSNQKFKPKYRVIPVVRMLKSLQNIRKTISKNSKAIVTHNVEWKRVKSSDYYRLNFTSDYQSMKTLLKVLLSARFSGEIIDIIIQPVANGGGQEPTRKLVHTKMIVKPKTENPGGLKNITPKMSRRLKTSLLNIIYPKKLSVTSPKINLFH